jgi:hypothetical protein
MSPRTLLALLLSLLLAVGGCERDDAQAALEKANSELQESLEAKRAAALRDALHPDFLAQDRHDRNWATRTAGTLFLRHRNVRVLVLSGSSWIDPALPARGFSEAQVALSGAEGLLPERLGHYQVRLEWWRENERWLLARMYWQ